MGEVMARYTYDSGFNGRQPDDGLSLGPSRLGAGVTGEVMARHTSDSGSNGHQPDDRLSLGPLRSGPFSFWA
ncbi:hypothetical protein HAX54_048833 [Datura stramonium]|uniref:Uncharacterized protein n=1 Tax=Datura stramonium TaxID=4076 RepID=A0ABS8SUC7_DATST|nr:hypothetical protein [Datura stramonium]